MSETPLLALPFTDFQIDAILAAAQPLDPISVPPSLKWSRRICAAVRSATASWRGFAWRRKHVFSRRPI